jgi:hypothetical protein
MRAPSHNSECQCCPWVCAQPPQRRASWVARRGGPAVGGRKAAAPAAAGSACSGRHGAPPASAAAAHGGGQRRRQKLAEDKRRRLSQQMVGCRFEPTSHRLPRRRPQWRSTASPELLSGRCREESRQRIHQTWSSRCRRRPIQHAPVRSSCPADTCAAQKPPAATWREGPPRRRP